MLQNPAQVCYLEFCLELLFCCKILNFPTSLERSITTSHCDM